MPKFLGNPDRDNASHISIMHYDSSTKKKKNQNDLLETKKKIIELKKEMLYTKTLNDKLVESDLISTNKLGSINDYFNETYRSDYFSTLNSTNRTTKSVKFNDTDINKENDNKQLDYLTNKATTDRYKKLTDFVNQTSFRSSDQNSFKLTDTLNLSLPPTPRINNNAELATLDLQKQFKSLETLNETSSLKFIQEYYFYYCFCIRI